MCLEVADEAYPGEEASPTGRAEVGRRCAVGADGYLALRAACFCLA